MNFSKVFNSYFYKIQPLGLDPAGIRFTTGSIFEAQRIEALPELIFEKLSKNSASFVDVIHTDGGYVPCMVFCPLVS